MSGKMSVLVAAFSGFGTRISVAEHFGGVRKSEEIAASPFLPCRQRGWTDMWSGFFGTVKPEIAKFVTVFRYRLRRGRVAIRRVGR